LLIRFIATVRPPLLLADYPSPIDLQEILAIPANQARTRLWLDDDGSLAGYGLVDHFDNVCFDVIPDGKAGNMCREILDWAQEAIKAGRKQAGPCSLDTNCRSQDKQRIALLIEKGFVPQGLATHTLVRSLRDAIPQPAMPPSWTIRTVKGEVEVDALVALHRAAFGTDHLTVDERLSWMRAPHYIPALDIVLVAAAGDLAGYCMCGIEREANEITGQSRGYTDPVAVHPEYRGLGGARALISRGMALLAERGMTEAVLNTSSDNRRMLQVASALGYVVESSRVWYSKALG
jgi:ribosomal protein S18 acetylase RimI-like enzyme